MKVYPCHLLETNQNKIMTLEFSGSYLDGEIFDSYRPTYNSLFILLYLYV